MPHPTTTTTEDVFEEFLYKNPSSGGYDFASS